MSAYGHRGQDWFPPKSPVPALFLNNCQEHCFPTTSLGGDWLCLWVTLHMLWEPGFLLSPSPTLDEEADTACTQTRGRRNLCWRGGFDEVKRQLRGRAIVSSLLWHNGKGIDVLFEFIHLFKQMSLFRLLQQKYHRLGVLNNSFGPCEVQDPRHWQIGCLMRTRLLVPRQFFVVVVIFVFLCPHLVVKGSRDLSGALTPAMKAPASWLNHLPKTLPPKTITFGLRLHIWILRITHIQSRAASLYQVLLRGRHSHTLGANGPWPPGGSSRWSERKLSCSPVLWHLKSHLISLSFGFFSVNWGY